MSLWYWLKNKSVSAPIEPQFPRDLKKDDKFVLNSEPETIFVDCVNVTNNPFILDCNFTDKEYAEAHAENENYDFEIRYQIAIKKWDEGFKKPDIKIKKYPIGKFLTYIQGIETIEIPIAFIESITISDEYPGKYTNNLMQPKKYEAYAYYGLTQDLNPKYKWIVYHAKIVYPDKHKIKITTASGQKFYYTVDRKQLVDIALDTFKTVWKTGKEEK